MRISGKVRVIIPTLRLMRTMLLTTALLALAACDGEHSSNALRPAPTGTFRVVSSLPSKGIYREETELTRRAIDLALADLVAGSGLSIEHVPLEGGSNETGEWAAPIEQANAGAAAADPSVIAYFGPHNSGAAGIALPITSRAGLLTFSPSATWPGLTVPGWDDGEPERYYPTSALTFVRLSPPDVHQADAAAEWVAADGHKTAFVLHDGSTFSDAMARAFVGKFPSEVGEPVPISTTATEFRLPHLEGYDAVFFAPSSVRSAGSVAAALSDSALPVYSTDVALDSQFLEVAGEAASNWHIVSNGDGTIARELLELYPASPPELGDSRPAHNAYIVARLVVDALQDGADNRSAVLSYVCSKRLADGRLLFDKAGDPTVGAMTGYVAVDGEFQPVREFAR